MPITSRRNYSDLLFGTLTQMSSWVIVVTMLGIFLVLLQAAWPAFSTFGLSFFSSKIIDEDYTIYGAMPSIFGTTISTLLALVIAVPTAFFIALFLVELAPPSVATIFGGAVELLAAIPSIIYGMWGLFVFAPFVDTYIRTVLISTLGWTPFFKPGPRGGISVFTTGIVLAIMILPYITSVTRDVFRMVPPVVRESAHGVGATMWETTWQVTLPYCLGGIVGGVFLGMGRALGETMAVAFIIGNSHRITWNLLSSGTTIAATLANDWSEAAEGLPQASLLALGLVLFLMSFLFQVLAGFIVKRLELKGR